MLGTQTANITENWAVRYSSFVDDLSIYDDSIGIKKREDLRRENISDDISVVYDMRNNKLTLVKIGGASSRFGKIDSMEKEDIIKTVKEFLHEQGK